MNDDRRYPWRHVQLEHVEPGLVRVVRGTHEFVPDPVHVGAGHLARGLRVGFVGQRRGRDEIPVARLERMVDTLPAELGRALAPRVAELHAQLGAGLRVTEIDDAPERIALRFVPQPVHPAMRASSSGQVISTKPGLHAGRRGLPNEAQRDAFRRIVDFCHAQSGAKLCMQLGHAGRKGSTQLGWERIDHPLESGNWDLVAPSPLPYETYSQTPREMTRADMDRIRDEFVRSANYANQAGFDMLELHMAHGYLLSSFISPLTNLRKGRIRRADRQPAALSAGAVPRGARPCGRRTSRCPSGFPPPTGRRGDCRKRICSRSARAFKGAGVDLIDVSTRPGRAAPEAEYTAHVPDAVRRQDPQRNRARHDGGRQHHQRRPSQHHRRLRTRRPGCARRARISPIPTSRCTPRRGISTPASSGPGPIYPGVTRRTVWPCAIGKSGTAGRQATKPPSHEVKENSTSNKAAADPARRSLDLPGFA